MNIRGLILKASYAVKRPAVLKAFREVKQSEYWTEEQRVEQQNQRLRLLVDHARENVPYYRKLFKSLGIGPGEITCVNDLKKLPILEKQTIKENPSEFYAERPNHRVVNHSTGGSTGVPLKCRLSDRCYSTGVALLWRGWGYGGWKPGNRLVVVAGGSLVNPHVTWQTEFRDHLMNIRHYSSYGMGDAEIADYFRLMNEWKPEYLRGYASSLYILAKYTLDHSPKLNFRFKSAFTTAEVLTEGQRNTIQRAFNCEVFNTYGLNDGGISAYECQVHSGMHIDHERAITEVVDQKGEPMQEGQGRLLATSLHNFAMPFIRYNTGDIGVVRRAPCSCRHPGPLLMQVLGRTTDFLRLNGKYIGSPQLTVLMGKFDLQEYQIVQNSSDSVEITIAPGPTFQPSDQERILASFTSHVGPIRATFKNASEHPIERQNKHKFIINNFS